MAAVYVTVQLQDPLTPALYPTGIYSLRTHEVHVLLVCAFNGQAISPALQISHLTFYNFNGLCTYDKISDIKSMFFVFFLFISFYTPNLQ